MPKLFLALPFVLLTALCWGAYGPVLREGSELMGKDRLRPFICVGIAYLVVAIVMPILLLQIWPGGEWTSRGTIWSLVAGMLGAIGALGIILAFNVGGSPIWVMPTVFGFAPVVAAFTSLWLSGNLATARDSRPFPWLLAGLIMVGVGTVFVQVAAVRITSIKPKPAPESRATPPAEPNREDVAATPSPLVGER